MQAVKLGVVLLLAAVLVAMAPAALAAGRVALVVGNGTYAHIGQLPNPANDAADMTAALRRLGFEVTTVRDADRAALAEALRVFTRESAGAAVSLVFYAGYGLEMDGVNYLVPVGRAPGAGHGRAVRGAAAGAGVAGDDGGGAAGGDPGRVPEQPPPPSLNAADGGAEREPGELRRVGRVAAGIRDAGGVRGRGGDNGGGRRWPEQPVHVGLTVVSRAAAGDRRAVPAG